MHSPQNALQSITLKLQNPGILRFEVTPVPFDVIYREGLFGVYVYLETTQGKIGLSMDIVELVGGEPLVTDKPDELIEMLKTILSILKRTNDRN